MKKTIGIDDGPNSGNFATLDISKYACSECEKGIDPNITKIKTIENFGEGKAFIECPLCGAYQLGRIKVSLKPGYDFTLLNFFSTPKITNDLPEKIKAYEDFNKYYIEAKTIEAIGLTCAGAVYRKALEHLVTEYAVRNNPGKEEEINNSQNLSSKIKKYVDDDDIKQFAQFSAWVGNDHVHTQSKRPELDIEDLKQLIEITIHSIEMKERKKHYKERLGNP